MAAFQSSVEAHIKLHARVVPYHVIQQKCEEVERGLLQDKESHDLCKNLVVQLDENSAPQQIKDNCLKIVEQTITTERLKLLAWIQKIRTVDILDVKKEVQRNDWFIDFIEEALQDVGLYTIKEFHHNKYSLFGRSRPDLAFYVEEKSWIKVGIIVQEDQLALCGAAIEFKMVIDDQDNILPQAFANMVRVSNDLLIDGLKTGRIIDLVTVYGLMVAHNKSSAVLLKYHVDFATNMYKIKVGERGFLGNVFSLLVFVGLLGQPRAQD